MSMYQRVKKFMVENAYTHTDEWLQQCVDWVQTENPSISENEFKNHIYLQWVDADLMELGSSCLPANLSAQKCTMLLGKYGVQMNGIQDIGESAYSQLKQIRKLENENTGVSAEGDANKKWEPKPKRCLYLKLTDGSQEVFGLEFCLIPALSLDLRPGLKIVLVGPIESRRGVLQLRPSNVKIKGGFVESLLETHSVVALLSAKLKIPVDQGLATQGGTISSASASAVSFNPPAANDNDFPDDDDFPEDGFPDDDDLFMQIDEAALIGSTDDIRNNSMMTTQGVDEDDPPMEPLSRPKKPPVTSKAALQGTIATRNKAAGPKPKANLPTTSSSTITTKPPKNTKKKTTATNNNAKQLKIDGYMKPMPVVIKPRTPPVKPPFATKIATSGSKLVSAAASAASVSIQIQDSNTPRTSSSSCASISNIFEDSTVLISDDDDQDLMNVIEASLTTELNRIEREELLAANSEAESTYFSTGVAEPAVKPKSTGVVLPSVNTPATLPIKVSPSPYIYIQQVKTHLEHLVRQEKRVYVKACIATIVSNIDKAAGCWTLTVNINDGTGFLVCKIAAELLNSIIGFDPSEMKRLKSLKTQAAKDEIQQGLQRLATKLVHLSGIFGIRLKKDSEPVIENFCDFGPHHLGEVKQRTSVLNS